MFLEDGLDRKWLRLCGLLGFNLFYNLQPPIGPIIFLLLVLPLLLLHLCLQSALFLSFAQ